MGMTLKWDKWVPDKLSEKVRSKNKIFLNTSLSTVKSILQSANIYDRGLIEP